MPHSDAFLLETQVSRETLALYEAWHSLLLTWNKRINLVAKSTLPEFWTRHALDSWQITPYFKATDKAFLDFGSGAGFPGIAGTIALLGQENASMTLTESAGKKASFLRTVIRDLDLPAKVHRGRIEGLAPFEADIITARAFAPLDRLLSYAEPFLGEDTRLILLKGLAVDEELEHARATWTFESQTVKSLSDETGCVLIIENIKRS